MALAKSMLLLMLHKAATLQRPIICPTRKKLWRQCGLLPISSHISMVNALFWSLTISLYVGSWSQISLLESSPRGFSYSKSDILRWYTMPAIPTWMRMDSHTMKSLRMKTWPRPDGMGYHTPLYVKCPKHHGYKGDPDWHPRLGTSLMRAPSVGNAFHPGRTRVRPSSMCSLRRVDFRMLYNTSIGGVS